MDNKTLSIISYITFIGWLIGYFANKGQTDDFRRYHLRQSFGLFIILVIFNVALAILVSIAPVLSVLFYLGYVFLVLAIIGCINASNNARKPLPIIGSLFEEKFSFIG